MADKRDLDALNNELFENEDEDTMANKFLTFHISGQDYGIEIRYVTEIVGIQKITEVPDMPDFVKGVINLRGSVIPVMDVRLRFRMKPRDYDDRTCVIVVRLEETSVGMVVDTVNEVVDIPDESISPPPKVSSGPGSRFILGMGKIEDQVKILLDVNKLLFEEELQKITEMSE
ncbi:MAG: purine-binding chemotaxis protein CheW [Planctomycetes bacterium]|nr:purine-binding chemotaxis protein CheW [Planctomycetota bacterium]